MGVRSDGLYRLRGLLTPALVSVVVFSLVLTAAFVGLVGLLTGEAVHTADRLPLYVLAGAVAFLLALLKLDSREVDGLVVLLSTTGIGIGVGILVGLAGEGVAYATAQPEAVLTSHLLVYFLAASIICSGLGVWSVRHWREFAGTRSPE